MSKQTTVINLFAGPGAGKSSLCAATFAALKWANVNCEMALEYAKDMTWQNSFEVLANQLYVFGKQQHRLFRLKGKVDVIITDSPLLNSIIYDAREEETKRAFVELILHEYRGYDNLDFFVERRKRYNPSGRSQTEEQARALDDTIWNTLISAQVCPTIIPGVQESVGDILVTLFAHRPELKQSVNST